MWPLRLALMVPHWILQNLISFPLYLIGWIVVPFAAACGAYKMTDDNLSKPADGPIYHFTWRWMFLWDNSNDGIACRNYWVAPNLFLQIVYWSCVRNPVNNAREVFGIKIDSNKIRFIGCFANYTDDDFISEQKEDPSFKNEVLKYDTKIPQWFFCWHGIYSNIYIQWNMFGGLWRFWIGTCKAYPDMIYNIPHYLRNGSTSVIQFKKVKKW